MLLGRKPAILWAFAGACACLLLLASCSAQPGPTQYKILFVGDTSFGENYQVANQRSGKQNILEEKGYDHPLQKLKDLLEQADLVIANLETPITDIATSPYAQTKDYVHWTDVELAPKYLKKYNIHTVSLANNHTLDFAEEGLRQTLDVLRSNGMEGFGAGLNQREAARPLHKELPVGQHVFKLAVIAAFEYHRNYDRDYRFYAREDQGGVNPLSLQAISAQIAELKTADPQLYVVVFPHWGQNYLWKTKQQTKLAHGLVDAGADLVIGHGAHLMQEIEQYRGRWIVYSLGNFMFNSPGRYPKYRAAPFSLAAQLVVCGREGRLAKSLRIYPILTDNQVTDYQTRPLTEDEFDNAYSLLLANSPQPAEFRRQVQTGKDDLGRFLELTLD